jgi:hypothetical protein
MVIEQALVERHLIQAQEVSHRVAIVTLILLDFQAIEKPAIQGLSENY